MTVNFQKPNGVTLVVFLGNLVAIKKVAGDAWYPEGWSTEGCIEEGWSTEYCIVEKKTDFADFWEKCEIFVLESFPIFNIFFAKDVFK